VIKPALAEIEEKNGLKVAFEKLKDGKTIKTLKFSFKIEKPETKPKAETKRTTPLDTKLSTKAASIPDDNQIKSVALSQFLGYQQRAKLLKESIEQHLKQNATKKEIKQFQEYGFIQ
jgi:plasmid replication initiation protein